MTDRDAFLAGERPEDVAFFLREAAVSNPDALADLADPVEDGLLLVVPGEEGRSAFQSATGIDPMELAGNAMETDGEIDPDLTGGSCPASEDGSEADESSDDHAAQFVFAFVEAQNEAVGGLYAEGDVVHAYAVCTCGETYSQKWLAGER